MPLAASWQPIVKSRGPGLMPSFVQGTRQCAQNGQATEQRADGAQHEGHQGLRHEVSRDGESRPLKIVSALVLDEHEDLIAPGQAAERRRLRALLAQQAGKASDQGGRCSSRNIWRSMHAAGMVTTSGPVNGSAKSGPAQSPCKVNVFLVHEEPFVEHSVRVRDGLERFSSVEGGCGVDPEHFTNPFVLTGVAVTLSYVDRPPPAAELESRGVDRSARWSCWILLVV